MRINLQAVSWQNDINFPLGNCCSSRLRVARLFTRSSESTVYILVSIILTFIRSHSSSSQTVLSQSCRPVSSPIVLFSKCYYYRKSLDIFFAFLHDDDVRNRERVKFCTVNLYVYVKMEILTRMLLVQIIRYLSGVKSKSRTSSRTVEHLRLTDRSPR